MLIFVACLLAKTDSARMAESVDAQDLKSCAGNSVRVQVPLRVPKARAGVNSSALFFFAFLQKKIFPWGETIGLFMCLLSISHI